MLLKTYVEKLHTLLPQIDSKNTRFEIIFFCHIVGKKNEIYQSNNPITRGGVIALNILIDNPVEFRIYTFLSFFLSFLYNKKANLLIPKVQAKVL